MRCRQDLVRHLDRYLQDILETDEILTLEEIADKLGESHRIRLAPATIEKRLASYSESCGVAPLVEDEERYKLNNEFYNP
jgi:hypothetical protein